MNAAPLGGSELLWEAPPGCPKREEVAPEFERITRESKKRVQARVVMVPREGGYLLSLTTRIAAEVGQREISGSSCDELAATALAILGWMVRDESTRAEQATVPPERPRGELRPSAGVRLAFDVGSLPKPTLGAGISAGLAYDSLALDLHVTYWVPRTKRSPSDGPEASGEFSLLSIGVSPCWSPFQGRWRLSACALAEGGVFTGRGEGDLSSRYTEVSSYWAAGASLGLLYSPTRAVALIVPRIDLLANLNRHDWVVRAAGGGGDPVLLYRPSEVIFRAATGVVFQ